MPTLLLAFDLGAISRDEAPGGWMYDIYTPEIKCHYGEEGAGVHSLLLGGNDGHLYQYGGVDDAGSSYAMEFTTKFEDQNTPRSNKYYGDIMIDADTDGLDVTATPQFNNGNDLFAPTTINTTSRELSLATLGTLTWFTARNIALNCQATITQGARPLFYIWEPRWTPESATISGISWEFSTTAMGMSRYKHTGLIKVTHVSTVDINFTVQADDLIYGPFLIPNSGGNYQQTVFRITPIKGKLLRFRLSSSDNTTEFRLAENDTWTEVKDWGSDGPFLKLGPFGGSQAQDSGV